MKKFRHITAITALGLTASLALAGCATGNDTAGGDGGEESKGTITLGFLPSWTDGLSMAYLLQDQFEKLGYTVEMQTLTEAGPLYTGLAQGDVDMYPSAGPRSPTRSTWTSTATTSRISARTTRTPS